MSLFQDHVLNRAVLIVIPFSILQDKMLFSYTHRGVFLCTPAVTVGQVSEFFCAPCFGTRLVEDQQLFI